MEITYDEKQVYFSVIIPAYNAGPFIVQTLDSVVNQTYSNFEIVITNDGSTDNTEEIILQYIDAHPSLQIYLFSQINKGLGNARNNGIFRARGKYLAFLDADDSWLPEKLLSVHKMLSEDENIELICHNEFMISASNRMIKKNYYGPYNEFHDLLFNGNCLSPSAVTVKREVFDKVGVFNEDRNLHGIDDYDMWLRMSIKGVKYCYIDDFLGNYIIHGNNMSTSFKFFETQEKIMLIYCLKTKKNFKNYFRMRKMFLIF